VQFATSALADNTKPNRKGNTMRKAILGSTFAILGLGLGTADAFENIIGFSVTDNFGFSEQTDLPISKRQPAGLDAIENSGTIVGRRGAGYPQFGAGRIHSYNAADDFGPSEQDDLPSSLSKGRSGGADIGNITSSTGVETRTSGYPRQLQFGRGSRGYNASDDFAVSDD